MTTIDRALGIAAAALLLAAPAQAQRQVNARQEASPAGRVEVELNGGSLRVVGWSRGEVQVTGTLARPSDRLEVDGGGRMVEVRVQGARGRAGPAHLEIRVPAGSTLELTAHDAPITVSGITGAVEATAHSGAVVIQGNPRRVEVLAHSGAVTLDGQTDNLSVTAMSGAVRVTGAVRQRAEIQAMSGSVELLGPVNEARVNALSGGVRVANATGRVQVEAVSGNVNVTGTRLRGDVKTVAGNVVVTGTLGGALEVESHAGNVELRLPASTAAEVQVATFNGRLQSDFGGAREHRGPGVRERHVSIGRGGPAVTITTFSGDVKLTRR